MENSQVIILSLIGILSLFALSTEVSSIGVPLAFGQVQDPIVVTTDKASYSEGETILITGEVSQLLGGYSIAFTMIAPNGNIVIIEQLAVGADKRFSTSYVAGDKLMMEEGTYTITVQYGDSKSRLAETTFEFGGVTEETPDVQSIGMSITATADEGSDKITVTGKTVSVTTDVTFRVTSPSGNYTVAVSQVSPDDNGEFTVKFTIGSNWTEDGLYSITAQQGVSSLYTLTVLVEVIGGMAEKTDVTESNLDTGGILLTETSVTRDAGLVLDEIVIENGSNMFEITGTTDRLSQDVTLTVIAPNGDIVFLIQISPMLDGKFISVITIDRSLWKQDGFYTVNAHQNDNPKYQASFEVDIEDGLVVGNYDSPQTCKDCLEDDSIYEPPSILDTTPPKILKPTDITVNAKNQNGAVVTFDVLTIDDTDEIVNTICNPSSNSFFQIGETRVICNARDSSGNRAIPISFNITVHAAGSVIPEWVKNVAAFWCEDKIDDASFIEGIQYLIDNEIITVSVTPSSSGFIQDIPQWVKNNACWWSKGLITDKEFASGIEFLVKAGIIRV